MRISYNINTVYLIPGDACNLSCTYCSQHELHGNEQETAVINPEVFEYIKKIVRSQDKQLSVVFFGGEPLVYWKQVKEAMEQLRGYNIRFSVVSNGTLFNEEMAKVFNDFNANLQLSWDGANVAETRGVDVLKTNRENILKVNRLCLAGVMSSKNYPLDFVKVCDEFDKEYYPYNGRSRHTAIHFDYIRSDSVPELTDNIDMDKWESQIAKMVEDAIDYKTGKRPYTTAVYQVDKIFKCLRNGQTMKFTAPRCGSGMTTLHLGINGDIYACHNDRTVIGDIHNTSLDLIRNVSRLDTTPEIAKTCDCFDCDAAKLCCNCYYQLSLDARQRYYCELMRRTIKPVQERQDDLNMAFGTIAAAI